MSEWRGYAEGVFFFGVGMDMRIKNKPGWRLDITLCSGNVCVRNTIGLMDMGFVSLAGVGMDVSKRDAARLSKFVIESKRRIARAYKRDEYE